MSEKQNIFLAPRLTGSRFEDHTLPVDILEDFSALQELIIELAKKRYLTENPTRKRVPKGFSDGIDLKLTHIEPGSSIPQFIITSTIGASSFFPNSDTIKYIEQARDEVINTIENANNGKLINLEPRYLSYFNKIGKNLLEDEAIDFTNNGNSIKSAVLSQQSRKKILLSRNEKLEYSQTITANVLIPSIDKKNNSIVFEIEGKSIPCSLENDFKETVFAAFNEYEKNTLVALKATGIFNANDNLISIEDIESMDVLDPFDVSVRLSELASLKDNWYEGYGKALNKDALNNFDNSFKSLYDTKLPLPAIFPTIDGNIQLEWTAENNEITLEVDLANLQSSFFFFNTKNDAEYDQNINLAEEKDWLILNELIEKYTI